LGSAPKLQSSFGSLRESGAIVLVSCYELGQQPLGLAGPDAHLRRAGFHPELIDIGVDPLDEGLLSAARLVAISVPMHTALRIGVAVAKRVRALNPSCHVALFGLYAALNATHLLETVADSCFGGEFEPALVDLAVALDSGREIRRAVPDTRGELASARKTRGLLPSRDRLPPLSRYARLVRDELAHVVGSVVTTRGCKHLCRHCPVVPVYNGRFYAIPFLSVMDDIRQVIHAGATHISFGDPDFLNGPGHARRIAGALHEEFPDVTFDFTAKIEHLVRHRPLVRELQDRGCVFVVSAAESLSDRVLAALAKGHTPVDVRDTVRFFKTIGLALRPTFVPFTPWETLDDLRSLLAFVDEEDLIDHVDPVQFTIRLLVPPGSVLATSEVMRPYLGGLDPENFTFEWHHPDERMDELQRRLASLVADSIQCGDDPAATFFRIVAEVDAATGRPDVPEAAPVDVRFPRARIRPPRLTETWFC
jgi:radical SAM superfamily enzyme YgiQ (UPF0313 family)